MTERENNNSTPVEPECCVDLGYNMLGTKWHYGRCTKWPKKLDTKKFFEELGFKVEEKD